MSARIAALCISLTGCLSFPVSVPAQDQDALTKAEFEAWKKTEFEGLKTRADALEQDTQKVTKDVETLRRQVKPLVPLKKELSEVRERVNGLEGNVNSLIDVANNQTAALRDIAKQVSQGGTDAWIPDIRKAMGNPEFQQDMVRAVHDSMHQRATLRIQNKTTVGHTVLVNNSQSVYIPAGQTRVVRDLPVGTVSTELVGYERPRNWTLGPPNYDQQIDIMPNSPARVILVNPPIVVGPPVIVAPAPIFWW